SDLLLFLLLWQPLSKSNSISSLRMDAGHNYQVRTLTAVAQAAIEVLSCRSSVKNVLGNVFSFHLVKSQTQLRSGVAVAVIIEVSGSKHRSCHAFQAISGRKHEVAGLIPGLAQSVRIWRCCGAMLKKRVIYEGLRLAGQMKDCALGLYNMQCPQHIEGNSAICHSTPLAWEPLYAAVITGYAGFLSVPRKLQTSALAGLAVRNFCMPQVQPKKDKLEGFAEFRESRTQEFLEE
uniref:MICOS complex subunit n=1 Tax=Sus scrofa TaxID=9823 RepID=A0A8D1CYW5_PIG